ncbi:hypothetical protein C0J52_18451 [Blattella germanica]|nr:hypothetical protein C0J52_18451 [Blattella germanica]
MDYETILQLADSDGKIDVSFIRFILQFKNDMISMLNDKVKVLTDHLYLTKHLVKIVLKDDCVKAEVNKHNSVADDVSDNLKSVTPGSTSLAPDTECEDVIDFLKSDFPEVNVEKLDSRHPELYASFKVSVCENNVDLVLNSDLWPRSARIRRFSIISETEEQGIDLNLSTAAFNSKPNLSILRNELVVLQWNAQGIINKTDEIRHILNKYNVDILSVSEHWLDAKEIKNLNIQDISDTLSHQCLTVCKLLYKRGGIKCLTKKIGGLYPGNEEQEERSCVLGPFHQLRVIKADYPFGMYKRCTTTLKQSATAMFLTYSETFPSVRNISVLVLLLKCSYKVTINMDNLDNAMNPDVWPEGVMVTRYFLRRDQGPTNISTIERTHQRKFLYLSIPAVSTTTSSNKLAQENEIGDYYSRQCASSSHGNAKFSCRMSIESSSEEDGDGEGQEEQSLLSWMIRGSLSLAMSDTLFP